MKRSEVNAILREADAFFRSNHFWLPPFAHWSPDEWAGKGKEVREIVDRQLGWDVTDFNSGNFSRMGLLLFTIRNGDPAGLKTGRGKLYAEKIMLVEVDQVTPMHYHWQKTEDIINRGGGRLIIQLYNSTEEGGLAGTDVTVSVDGTLHTLKAGDRVVLSPGESVTLPAGGYHSFWGAESKVMVGEVSLVNDDRSDNRFHESLPRFSTIEEDEPPLYLLCTDYDRYYRP